MTLGKTFQTPDGQRTVAITGTVLLLGLSSGCYVGVGESPAAQGDTEGGTETRGGDPADADGSDGSDGGEPAQACADAPMGATVLRRLTADEYRNTIGDLFGVEPPPLEMLPTDGRPRDFRSTAGQMLTPATTMKYFDAARFVAERRAAADPQWFPCTLDDGCVDDHLRDEGRQIFRRPLSDDEVSRYHTIFTRSMDVGDSPTEAADTMLQSMLVSPNFLYLTLPDGDPGERVDLDDWQIASRLSFLLWASTPDDALLDAAAAGELGSPSARAEMAERLLEDPRAEDAVDAFFMQWLTAENISLVAKDPALHPEVTPELTAALEEESRLYFREIFWNRGASLQELFTSPVRVRNGALSAYYGDDLVPADQTEMTVVEGDVSDEAFGMLSQAGMLMTIGRNTETKIIYRGVFVQNKLLCSDITLTSTDMVPPLPEVDPAATSRDQVAQHTAAPTCAGCHSLINPPGFALEHFDTTGRWRDDERGLKIDASAEILGLGDGPVDGALELSAALGSSDLVRSCAMEQMFEFAIGREPTGDDSCITDELSASMLDSGDDLQALLVQIVASEAFAQRVAPEE